jgi:predicted dehydrogenase
VTKAYQRLGAAVIGCGAIAHEHLTYLSSSPLVRLVGVCDSSRVAARFAQHRFRAEQWFTDVDEMLSVTRPDVVHVLTPPETHKRLIELCLAADTHVICEKPMSTSTKDTTELLAKARSGGKALVESRNMLYNDALLKIDRLVSDGRLGVIKEVDILLSLDLTAGPFGDLNLSGPGAGLPGGAVHDFVPHLAYLFLHFAGASSRIDRVAGTLNNLSGNGRVGFDHMDALVRAGDCRGRLRVASDVRPDAFRLVIRGSAGTVETDFYNPILWTRDTRSSGIKAPLEQIGSGLSLALAGVQNMRDKVARHGTYHGMPRMLRATYQDLCSGRIPPVDEAEMIATASLVDQLVQLGTDS